MTGVKHLRENYYYIFKLYKKIMLPYQGSFVSSAGVYCNVAEGDGRGGDWRLWNKKSQEGGLDSAIYFDKKALCWGAREIMLLDSVTNEVLTSAASALCLSANDTKRSMCLSEVEWTPLTQGGNLGRLYTPAVSYSQSSCWTNGIFTHPKGRAVLLRFVKLRYSNGPSLLWLTATIT